MSSNSRVVDVITLDPFQPSISVASNLITAKDLRDVIATKLCLREESMFCFAIFLGPTDAPFCVFKDDDEISTNITQVISFMKFCFDPPAEKRVLKDDAAVHILYYETQRALDMGKISPSEDQQLILDEFSDPSFPVEKQFMSQCHTIPTYWSETFQKCTIGDDFMIPEIKLNKNDTVTLVLSHGGITIKKDRIFYETSWRKVRAWTCTVNDVDIKFEILSLKSGELHWLTVRTSQAPYMLSVTMELIRFLQTTLPGVSPPQMSEVSGGSGERGVNSEDATFSEWTNTMYSSSTRRNTLDSNIFSTFTDLNSM